MPRLDRVAQREAVELLRQQVDEGSDVVAIELPARSELPQDRAELGSECGEALRDEIADALGALAEVRPHDAEARTLDRELEAVGNGLCPRFPALRLLPAVEGRVDLDRRQRTRDAYSSSFDCGELVGIEDAAPRRVGPAANADADLRFAHRSGALCSRHGHPQHCHPHRRRSFGRKRARDVPRPGRTVGGPSRRGCCTPEAFRRDPALVHAFYDARRAKLATVQPNAAHEALARLDAEWPGELLLVTQNVDDLHERAGSKRLHPHAW